jgi:hypothetical protein
VIILLKKHRNRAKKAKTEANAEDFPNMDDF